MLTVQQTDTHMHSMIDAFNCCFEFLGSSLNHVREIVRACSHQENLLLSRCEGEGYAKTISFLNLRTKLLSHSQPHVG